MFIYHKDQPLDDLGGGVTRRVLAHGGTMMAVEVRFEKGATGPLHHHPHEQLTYVLSGRFAFTIEGETREVGPGDTLYKAPDVVHGCVCLEAGVLLDTFTPQREDFLAAK
ncbi:cupin domain-containing protein [Pantoea sp. Bo_2]|uniref:Cupin domain-containing protein n=1 Tax=Candidatus Pantoea gossypiicola TaxID=2608008 RepID=A0AB34CKZ3_9GAMM|nr:MULTISPECIES: cupin domain-containing protein [Pantoea]KAA5933135.1 cupin domain-containing protein [Pantoea sp. VH_8]KAA5937922.1 cupin domain-containing protein [Pantoea sp. VH_4]KAA5950291.1 cupin domain-containing protein [Pantoea sp. VH_3]KAA5955664.1 cupin domain-containing protein [Pantoea sp. VH_25]KAA5960173.1 cupin domain-containing protein [Pantoea sp. VH_24]